MRGLYLHVPLCFHKCHYCDFYSVEHDADSPQGRDGQARFTDALLAECRTWADLRPRTIFVGGGTPTLLAARHWRRLLDALRAMGVLHHVDEFTVEANPETVSDDLAATLAAGGVNRVSIGCQSFNPAHLKTLERWHDPRNVSVAMDRFRAHGIRRINLDLIFGIPGQTAEDVAADLEAALALRPTHLSYYGLTYEPNTAMTQRLRQGRFEPVAEAVEGRMYDLIRRRLAEVGFEQYEISAWAGPSASGDGSDGDERCRHNLTYWTSGDYVGLGPGAASHVQGRRWKNAPRLSDYLVGSPHPAIVDAEVLTPRQQAVERLMMGLRLREGVTCASLPPDLPDPARVQALIDLGLLDRTPTHLRLTDRALPVSDSVIAELT